VSSDDWSEFQYGLLRVKRSCFDALYPRARWPVVLALLFFIDYHHYIFDREAANRGVTKQLKVSDTVYDDLDELKQEEDHTSFDSLLRELIMVYRMSGAMCVERGRALLDPKGKVAPPKGYTSLRALLKGEIELPEDAETPKEVLESRHHEE